MEAQPSPGSCTRQNVKQQMTAHMSLCLSQIFLSFLSFFHFSSKLKIQMVELHDSCLLLYFVLIFLIRVSAFSFTHMIFSQKARGIISFCYLPTSVSKPPKIIDKRIHARSEGIFLGKYLRGKKVKQGVILWSQNLLSRGLILKLLFHNRHAFSFLSEVTYSCRMEGQFSKACVILGYTCMYLLVYRFQPRVSRWDPGFIISHKLLGEMEGRLQLHISPFEKEKCRSCLSNSREDQTKSEYF